MNIKYQPIRNRQKRSRGYGWIQKCTQSTVDRSVTYRNSKLDNYHYLALALDYAIDATKVHLASLSRVRYNLLLFSWPANNKDATVQYRVYTLKWQ